MSISLSLVLSLIHLLTFGAYVAKYGRLRQNRSYAGADKPPVEKMPLARRLTKFAFVASSLLVLISFWMRETSFGYLPAPPSLRIGGVLLSLCAFLLLSQSLNRLGRNYSPLFDTHRPYTIVDSGPYQYIRHPVYLCNMLILAGHVLASASLVVLLLSLWGWGYMLRSISREEAFLANEFPEYRDYQKRSWRILPYVY